MNTPGPRSRTQQFSRGPGHFHTQGPRRVSRWCTCVWQLRAVLCVRDPGDLSAADVIPLVDCGVAGGEVPTWTSIAKVMAAGLGRPVKPGRR